MSRVLIYVQHLLGVGHLKRAALIGRALVHEGLQVTLISGGAPVPGLDTAGLDFRQLPPARAADESFAALVCDDGRAPDAAWREERCARLLEAFAQVRPHVLITEQFPFGRRHFHFELLPLLEAAGAARPRPWVVCSVRDILVEASRPGSHEQMAELAIAHFDRVLVHGDPALIPFEHTFPLAARIADRLHHTGYVAESAARPTREALEAHEGEVLVSAGSRQRGEPLVTAALAARPLTRLAENPWRILTGLNFPEERLRLLREQAQPGVRLERFRADFPQLLGRARLSISQGGYNTTMEVLQAGVPAVLAPHAAPGDREQDLRAQLLCERGAAVLPADLSARGLAEAVDKALRQPAPRAGGIDMGGAAATAALVARLAATPRPAQGA